jgi:hypothetical protein
MKGKYIVPLKNNKLSKVRVRLTIQEPSLGGLNLTPLFRFRVRALFRRISSSADRHELRGTNEYRPTKRPATLQGPSTRYQVVQRYPNSKSKSLTSGSDLPAAPEHTKGDDVWTFYRSVLAEYTSIEKVPSRLIQADSRQY